MGKELEADDLSDLNPYYDTLRDDFILSDHFHFCKEQIALYRKDPDLFEDVHNQGLLAKCYDMIELFNYYLSLYRRWNEENNICNQCGLSDCVC